ncbi:MAG: TetR/AcrR family transcriptional regulator [Clostridiaceae bacterium]
MNLKDNPTRQEKAQKTKLAIYHSAENLFQKHSFETVNVDDIVKNANVSKGSFYVHFDSKDALIAYYISDYVQRVDADYKSHLSQLPENLPIEEVLLSLVAKIAQVIEEDLGCENMKTLYRIQLSNTLKNNASLQYNRDLYDLFYTILKKGMDQEIFTKDLSPEEAADHFILGFRGLVYDWCVRDQVFSLKEKVQKHFNILIHGLTVH